MKLSTKQNIEHFHHPQKFPHAIFQPISPHFKMQSLSDFYHKFILPVLVLHLIKDVCVCVHVCICIHVSFTVSDIHPYCCTYQQFFLFIAEQYSIVGIYHNLFTHSLVDGYWGIQFQVVMNKVAMDIPELIFNFSLLKKTYYLNKFQTYRKLQKLKQHKTLILFIQIYPI